MSNNKNFFFGFLKNHTKRNSLSQYKLLNVFSFKKNIYLLRFNKNKLEIVNLKNQKKLKLENKCEFKKAFQWKNIRISKIDSTSLLLSFKTKIDSKWQVKNYYSNNLIHWEKINLGKKFFNPIFIAENYKYQKNNIGYFEKENKFYYCKIKNLLAENKTREVDLILKSDELKNKKLVLAGIFNQKKVLFLFYYIYKKNNTINLKVIILDKENPSKLTWSVKEKLWQSSSFDEKFYPIGIVKNNKNFDIYCKDEKEKIYYTELPTIRYHCQLNYFKQIKKIGDYQKSNLLLKKSSKNPILEPRKNINWETNGTFNPAAIFLKNKIHLIYRAVRNDHMSVFGYASSKNGIKIDERSKKPIYTPSESFEFVNGNKFSFKYPYMSGGGWGGCEDPRLSVIENKIYMTYTAFNGHQAPGVAITSIKINAFLDKKWNWTKPRLISEPGKIQKNWVIFPEKINGKYAILHSISPNISIDYFDNIDSREITIKSNYSRHSNNLKWESYLRGVASPPIKTDKGWLLFYHAMDHRNPNQYKLGAMLLNLKNPTKIIRRCDHPILEPHELYENNGKPGVIYVCGAILRNKKLYIYYGGADKVSCIATVKLEKLLNYLNSKQNNCLKNIKLRKN